MLHIWLLLSYVGFFRETMVHCLRALRTNHDMLLATMEVFVQEPSIEWLEFARKDERLNKNSHEGKPVTCLYYSCRNWIIVWEVCDSGLVLGVLLLMLSAVFTPDIYVLAVDSTFVFNWKEGLSVIAIFLDTRSKAQLMYKGACSQYGISA